MLNFKDQTLEYKEELGSGSCAVVKRAYLGGKEVAAKIFNKYDEKSIRKALSEVDKLMAFQHPNIIRSYGLTMKAPSNYVLLMEFAECGTLYKFMHGDGCEHRNATDVARLNWMLQLANALAYLHGENTAHRDVKPLNMVLTNNYKTLKLCDFGLVKQLVTNNTNFTGTVNYIAPEVSTSGQYTIQCDVFSFGIVLWEVMSNKKPFEDSQNQPVDPLARQNQINNGARPNLDQVKKYTDFEPIKNIMIKCWAPKPEDRPTMKSVAFDLSHDRHFCNAQGKCEPLPSTKDTDIILNDSSNSY